MARSQVEKVARLGIDRSTAGTIAFTGGAVVRFKNGERVELPRPELVEEEGWIYYVDRDGDLARRPEPNWTPPAAVRERLKTEPLAIFRAIPSLAKLEFTKLAVHDVTIYESTVLAPQNGAAIWRAAQARAREARLTAVLVSQRIRSDYFDALGEIIERDRRQLSKQVAATVLARRERDLLKELAQARSDDEQEEKQFGISDLDRLRQDLATARLSIPGTTAKRSYIFESSTPRLYLTLLSCEPWEVPLYLPVGGVNDAPTGVELAAMLRSWVTDWDPVPIYVDGLTLELEPRHTGTADAIRALAWQHYILCTDIVHQGTRTLTALARELAEGRWFFWWD